jgi:hypothetical protein
VGITYVAAGKNLLDLIVVKKNKKEFKKKSQDGLFLFAHLTHHSFRTTAALSLHTDSI